MRIFKLDPDVWWHLKVGATILETHQVPTADPYSFTVHGAPWIAYEWLGDVMMAAAHRAAGEQGLLALDMIVGSAILLALYYLCSERCGNSKAAFVACVAVLPLAAVSFSLRPQMFGYLFLVITLIALERFRQGKPRSLWLLPPLFLVWVNSHGSFVIGLAAMGVYWASGLVEFQAGGVGARRWSPAQRIRLELVALLCLIALTVTPYGTRLAAYPIDMALGQPLNVANIQEWASMPFDTTFGKLFLGLVIAFIVAQIALRPIWRLEELALLFAGIFMAAMHARFVLVFVPFFAPILATLLARWVPPYNRPKDQYLLNLALMALIVLGLVKFFPSRPALDSAVEAVFPVDAVRFMRQHPVDGPMFNQYGFGGYLIWQLGPEHRVFIDGRGDIYERAGVMADYLRAAYVEPGALAVLRSYGIKSCLLLKDEPLSTLLAASPDWQQVYSDKLSGLFVRRNPPPVAHP
ncbi:MAG TPA: hypothetical protein VL523_06095 [Terriglobia bacterium]|nr:hypothetical protein [Terriglobia bacterium]